MRIVRSAIAAMLLTCAAAAQATTIIIYIDPMTFERRHTRVIETPGRDRLLMCMAPPAMSGCTEVPIKPAQRR
jgi:hypothetical protein